MGNVGIGTSAPLSLLELQNGTGITTALNIFGNSITTANLATFTANALTTGSGLSIASTATALTGALAKIENSATTLTTNSGNLLQLGYIGTHAANGTALNLTSAQTGATSYVFRANDDGTYTDTTPFVIDTVGNVGIGVTKPQAKIDVHNNSNSFSALFRNNTYNVTNSFTDIGISGGTFDNGFVQGFLLRDVQNAGHTLSVYTMTGNTDGTGWAAANQRAFITSGTNGWQTPSDLRLKDNIVTMDNVLNGLKLVRGVTFNLKDSGVLQGGVIAQEFQQAFPWVVSDSGDTGKLGVNYNAVAAIALQGVKELDLKTEDLNTKLISQNIFTSDINLKTNIIDLSSMTDKFSQLRFVNFNWNDKAEEVYKNSTTSLNTGVIAQEVEKLFPELISIDDKGYKNVNFTGLQWYAFKSVQEQQLALVKLVNIVKDLDVKTEDLKVRIEKLESGAITSSTTSSLTKDIKDSFIAWFADASNGIKELFVDKVKTKELCIGNTCVTEEQLKTLLSTQIAPVNNTPAPVVITTPTVVVTPTPEEIAAAKKIQDEKDLQAKIEADKLVAEKLIAEEKAKAAKEAEEAVAKAVAEAAAVAKIEADKASSITTP